MTSPPKKQFVLNAPSPWRETSRITIEGWEWPDLTQACRSVGDQYGYLLPLEIHGRFFVLSASEALKFTKAKIPFSLGVYSNGNLTTLEIHEEHKNAWLQWIREEERDLQPADDAPQSEPENREQQESRKLEPTQFYVRPDGSVHFKVRFKHEVHDALQADGTPLFITDDPFVYWTETDLFVFSKFPVDHLQQNDALFVTRDISDAAMDDLDGSCGRIDMLDEENVVFLHFMPPNNQQ